MKTYLSCTEALELSPPEVDFGTLMHEAHECTRHLFLHNLGTVPLVVTSIRAANPDPHLTVISEKTITVPARTKVHGATLIYAAPSDLVT
jgi:hypothetical protein